MLQNFENVMYKIYDKTCEYLEEYKFYKKASSKRYRVKVLFINLISFFILTDVALKLERSYLEFV